MFDDLVVCADLKSHIYQVSFLLGSYLDIEPKRKKKTKVLGALSQLKPVSRRRFVLHTLEEIVFFSFRFNLKASTQQTLEKM